MEKDIQRRNVIDVLRSMDVGAIEVFPIVQKPSVTNTLNARLYKEKAEGMAWKTKSDVKNMQFIVTTLLVEMIRGEMAEILLDNILRLFSTETFGKDKSAYYVGGEKKLMNLIEAGKIESDKPVNAQNGKWHCNAAQVLLHCRCAKKVKRKKRKK